MKKLSINTRFKLDKSIKNYFRNKLINFMLM